MKVEEIVGLARDAIAVKRVFAEPIERDGIVVIPAAVVQGGAGGGSGNDEKGQQGEGGGFGMAGRPAGAFVVKDGELTWRPAVDVNRVLTIVGLVVLGYVLTRPRIIRARAASG